ncbi:MAG: sulfotransferase domain-containing protein [Pseudomonadota bacterium]
MKKTRPSSLTEMEERSKPLFSREGFKAGLALKLRPTDVVITPYGKSGTTWTQQIVHTLRTRGDMDFDDISRVVPWIETSVGLGLDLDAEQRGHPRAFKSHLSWDMVPKGGRYINVVRDPGDVIVSLFKFQEGWFLEPGTVSIDEFAHASFFKSRDYYKHLRSWWPRRNDDDVLFLAYEKMLKNPTETIQRIAAFIGIELDAELLAITEEHASLPFMLKYKDRFDDAMLRKLSEKLADLPEGSDSAKVREGKTGSSTVLSEEIHILLDATWQEEITSNLGFGDYPALIEAL